MTTCPKCHIQVSEAAKFCPECREQLIRGTSDPAWIAAMQEKIKDAKHKSMAFFGIGALLGLGAGGAFIVTFLMPSSYNTLLWIIGTLGVVICIGCFVGIVHYDNKVKSLTDQLAKGHILDFAQSLPLVKPGYNVNWLVDLMASEVDRRLSPAVYEQLLKGKLQIRYDPQWLQHPTYQEMTALPEGERVLVDLSNFVDAANRCLSQAVSLLQDIYRDAAQEGIPGLMEKGGWSFIAAVYADAMSWFRGTSLPNPSERDYFVKFVRDQEGVENASQALWLCGDDTTAFPGPLIMVSDAQEANHPLSLHLKLRGAYRKNERARETWTAIAQLEIQQMQLVGVLNQLGSRS